MAFNLFNFTLLSTLLLFNMNYPWINDLKYLLAEDELLIDSASCIAYSYDNGRHQQIPAAVALPREESQIFNLIHFCIKYRIPMTARGRGTGTPGGAVPSQDGLVISFERMNKVIEFCPESRYITVEPGVLNQTVQNIAGEKNLFWGPDPSSQKYCTIGGNVAYNASGSHSLKYGSTRDNVLYLEAITGSGMRIKTGAPVSKSAAGYDLTRLLIGSEGTLALFTKICLKLLTKPESNLLFQVWYQNEYQAAEFIPEIMQQPLPISALEFMDKNSLQLLRKHSNLSIPQDAEALLLIEIDGFTESLNLLSQNLEKFFPSALAIEINKDKEKAWQARKLLSPILRQLAPYKINEDIVIPLREINLFLREVKNITEHYQILNVNFGHAGNGNLHVNLLLDDLAQLKKAEFCLQEIFSLVIKLNGMISGEHGIGLEKKSFLNQAFSKETIELMQQIKQQFDPYHLLNPEKLLSNYE